MFLSKNTNDFIYFLAVLGLHCCVGYSLVSASGGYSLPAMCWLLIAVASLVAENLGFSVCDMRAH